MGHAVALLAVLAMAVAYEMAVRAGGDSARPRGFQRVWFHTGLLVLLVSVAGPLRLLADERLFSAHAVQFALLTLLAAPLLVIGLPAGMVDHHAGPVLRAVTKPARCFTIFNVVLAATHLPPVYALGMRIGAVQSMLLALVVASAVLMWWPLASPTPRLPRLSYPLQMLYCFGMSIPFSIVAVYLVAARTVLYPYPGGTLDDQRMGGLIMWVPSGLFFYGVLSVVYWKWQVRTGASAPPAKMQVPDPKPFPQ